MKTQNELTVSKSFNGTQLNVLKAHDDQQLFDTINNLLFATSMALNVKEKLNAFQAFDIVHMIMNDWPLAKLEQIVYLFKQGKKGVYGPHYNKIDIETITNWLNGFFNGSEFIDYLQKLNERKVEQAPLTDEQKNKWKEIVANFATFNREQKKGIKSPIVNKVSVNVFHERFKTYSKGLTITELKQLIKEYKTEAPDYVAIIQIELKNRTDEKTNS